MLLTYSYLRNLSILLKNGASEDWNLSFMLSLGYAYKFQRSGDLC